MVDIIKIAIIDDEEAMRLSISQWLSLSGFETVCFATAEKALQEIDSNFEGIIISDIKMPGIDGIGLLKKIQMIDSAIPVILITGHGDVQMAVEAMRIGAYDFLEKPFEPDRMADLVKRASNARKLVLDNRRLRRELADGTILMRRMMGNSPEMKRIREDILDLAQSDGNVLIQGETGSGKSLIANALHACGTRQGRRIETVHCDAYTDEALEKLLFGSTDEIEHGLLHKIGNGTICLESIDQFPETLQARLLDFLAQLSDQETDPSKSLRIISISSASKKLNGQDGNLRKELFYRLAAMQFDVPPLRERGEDILFLFNRYCEIFADDYGCDAPQISAKDATYLLQSDWPGNIRQLVNLAERAVLQIRRENGTLTQLLVSENPDSVPLSDQDTKPLKEYIEAFERMLIDNALRRQRGSIARVMEELSIPRRTLNEKMAKYGLTRSDYI